MKVPTAKEIKSKGTLIYFESEKSSGYLLETFNTFKLEEDEFDCWILLGRKIIPSHYETLIESGWYTKEIMGQENLIIP